MKKVNSGHVFLFVVIIVVISFFASKGNKNVDQKASNVSITPSTTVSTLNSPTNANSKTNYSNFTKDLKEYVDDNFGGKLAGEDTKTTWYDNIKAYKLNQQEDEVTLTITTNLTKSKNEKIDNVSGMVWWFANSLVDGVPKGYYIDKVVVLGTNGEVLKSVKNPMTQVAWNSWRERNK